MKHGRQAGLAGQLVKLFLTVFSCLLVDAHEWVQCPDKGNFFDIANIFERLGVKRLHAGNESCPCAGGHFRRFFQWDKSRTFCFTHCNFSNPLNAQAYAKAHYFVNILVNLIPSLTRATLSLYAR